MVYLETVLETVLAGILFEALFLINIYLAGRCWRLGRGSISDTSVINTKSVEINATNPTMISRDSHAE